MNSILITGATGTVGNLLVDDLLKDKEFGRIVVYSRDEFKQWEMRRRYNDDRLRFMLGDIRDAPRLVRALEGITHCVHAAALKQIDSGEYNPDEFVKTNIIGTMNVIDACLHHDVQRMVFISTDKAVEPGCLYGCTKATAEKLVLHAKAFSGNHKTSFAVVRMGNIAFARGSVIPLWKEYRAQGRSLPVTDVHMTRYWVDGPELCRTVFDALTADAHEVEFLPKAIAFKLIDLVDAFDCAFHVIGLRPGERLFEKLNPTMTSHEPVRFLSSDELRELIR